MEPTSPYNKVATKGLLPRAKHFILPFGVLLFCKMSAESRFRLILLRR